MPVRVEKLVAREGAYGMIFHLTEQEWNDLDNNIKIIDKWNKEVSTFVQELTKELSEEFSQVIKVTTRAFKTIYEEVGMERCTPRNYLSYEVVEVSGSTEAEKYLLGKHQDLEELRETIIQDFYVRRAKKAEPTGDGTSGENSISRDGGEPRKSRLERYTQKVCEGVDVLQPTKRRARGNIIQE